VEAHAVLGVDEVEAPLRLLLQRPRRAAASRRRYRTAARVRGRRSARRARPRRGPSAPWCDPGSPRRAPGSSVSGKRWHVWQARETSSSGLFTW
jgi:hypothetical protein